MKPCNDFAPAMVTAVRETDGRFAVRYLVLGA
jgi:hypothetical protein